MARDDDVISSSEKRESRPDIDARASVFLQPIASPSILGLFGFAGATLIVGARMAHWYGSPTSPLYLLPFAAFFGGLAQFMAGMWSYRARDGVATAMHGMWGSFWMAYGLLYLIAGAGYIKMPSSGTFSEMGFWYIVLAWITWVGALAAARESWGLCSMLVVLATAATVGAVGELTGSAGVMTAAGWVFVASAILAWYVASGMLLESTFGRVVFPIGKVKAKEASKISAGFGEAGVMHGQ